MNLVELISAFSGVTLQAVLLGVVLWKKQWRLFGWFLAYLMANLTRDLALLAVVHLERPYFYLYWWGEALVTLLLLLALYETFRHVFRNFYTLAWFRALFPLAGVALTAVGILRALLRGGSRESLLISEIFAFEIAAGILQIGILFLFLLLARFFRLSWRQYTFGVALGFGLSAAGSLVGYLVRSEFGTKFDPIFRVAIPLTYNLGVAIWLFTFLRDGREASFQTAPPAFTPEVVIAELKQYTRTVKEILKR